MKKTDKRMSPSFIAHLRRLAKARKGKKVPQPATALEVVEAVIAVPQVEKKQKVEKKAEVKMDIKALVKQLINEELDRREKAAAFMKSVAKTVKKAA